MATRLPRLARLVATWLIGYISYGVFFPIVAATAGVAAAYWVEVATAVNWTPDAISHSVDDDRVMEYGEVRRWIGPQELEVAVKTRLFSELIVAIDRLDPTWWARGAAIKYVSDVGNNVACSFASPGSMFMALTGGCTGGTNPGDQIWARGGTYTTNATTKRWLILRDGGTGAGQGIVIRNYQNEHVKMDCNADLTAANSNRQCFGPLNAAGANWTYWGLDFYNSSLDSRYTAVVNQGPTHMNNAIDLTAANITVINCFFRDQEIAILNNGHVGNAIDNPPSGIPLTGHVGRGNYAQYNGWVGPDRGYGREWYFKGADDVGETGRSVFSDMMSLRAFSNGIQLYATGDTVAFITVQDMVIAASGHGTGSNWAYGGSGWNNWYLGSSGNGIVECHTLGSKVLWKMIFDRNWSVFGNGGTTFGNTKGSCDSTITNSSFIFLNAPPLTFAKAVLGGANGGCHTGTPPVNFVCGGTWNPVTLSGNDFYTAPTGTGTQADMCEDANTNCALPFTQANYPGTPLANNYNAGYPGSGYKYKYVVNADELGRGRAYVMNWASTPSVTIDPSLMGCFPGEQIRIFNHQNNNPWDSTPAFKADGITPATQTGCAPISMLATLAPADMYQPGFTMQDGVTPFTKAPDLGPLYVAFEMYPDWALASTPTPTTTSSPTLTNTATQTRTFTPSLTATKTSTATVTFSPTVTPSQSATASRTATATVTPSKTFTPTVTPSLTPTPSGTFSTASFDLQNCVITAPMRLSGDTNALNGYYIDSTVDGSITPANGGTALCTFQIGTTGLYRAWVRISALNAQSDSMYVEFDGEGPSTHIFDMGEDRNCPNEIPPDELDTVWGQGWTWMTLKDRGQNCVGLSSPTGYERAATNGDASTAGIQLTAGPHTVKFYGREIGAKADYMIITNDFGYQPPVSSLTPTPDPSAHSHWCNNGLHTHAHSHGTTHEHNPCPWPAPTP